MKKTGYNFIDLFSGAGGLSLGFNKIGFNCIGAIDNMPSAIESHEFNFPESFSMCEDIRKIKPSTFSKKITGNVDLIIGGPPCPTFSTIGHPKIQSLKRDVYKDDRTLLFINFLEYVEYFQPKFFLIENVPNFITKYKGDIFDKTFELVSKMKGDYRIHTPVQVLNAANFGVPQKRKRMFLIGHKKEFNFNYPEPTHYIDNKTINQSSLFYSKNLKKNVTVNEALSDLPNITDNWRIDEVEYSNNVNLSEYQIKMRANTNEHVRNNRCRMSNDRAKKVFIHMKQGSKYMDLPPKIRRILPFREDIFHDRLKRLNNNEPSWTVIAHIGMDGYMYIHPTENRTLSVREAARIQSFPDDFIFFGNMQQSYVQVGNAVPPLLAEQLANQILNSLNN